MNRRSFLQNTVGIAALASCQRPTTKSSKGLRFAVASDGHYGQPNTPYQQNFEEIITNLKAEKEANGLDFVVFNGDLFHDDIKFLPEVKTYFDRLKMPYYVTRGNHDHVSPSVWKQTWGYELNSTVNLGDYGLILADTSNEKGEYLCPDIGFIENSLAKMSLKKSVFLFMHIPYKKWTPHGVTCLELEQLLAKYPNLKAAFHGHDHGIDVVKIAEKPFFFDGHFGGDWGVSYRGYRVVDVSADGEYKTYQFDPQSKTKINENSI